MEQIKTLEQQDDADKAPARPFSDGWEEAWKQLEERKRLTNPTYHFVGDFAEVGG